MNDAPDLEPNRPISAIDAALILAAIVLGPQLLQHAFVLGIASLRNEPSAIARETVAMHPIFGGVGLLVTGTCLLAFARRFYARGRRFSDAFGLHPVPGRTVALAAVVGATMQFPLAEIGNLVEEFVPVALDDKLLLERVLSPTTFIEGLGLVIAAVAVAPVIEELVFRGLLLPGIARGSGVGIGVVVSTLAFAIAHVRPGAVAIAFVGGLVLAFVTVRRDSTVPAIVLHAANNAIPIILPARVLPMVGVNVVSDGPSHANPWLVGTATLACATALAMLVQDED